MAHVILTQPGEDVDVGGDVTVIGTRTGGEVITLMRGTVVLDPSFNAGGDTVKLPDDAAFFTARLVGSSAILAGLGLTVTIPVGSAGLQVSFNDVSRTLLYDPASSSVKLGDQTITSTITKVAPAGSSATFSGTEGADIITGTPGNDVIDGFGGADRINGGAGDDIIRGGAGGDDLEGASGNDKLYGGPDADRLVDNEGSSAFLDGGTGNDWLSVVNFAGTRFDLIGGDGDDVIELAIGTTGSGLVDAGAGSDRVIVTTDGIAIMTSLGAGRDQLVFDDHSLDGGRFGVITLTDFQVGQFGDTVEFSRALSTYATGWNGASNPFASGHLQLVDRDGAAVLQVDRDGPGWTYGVQDLIFFAGLTASAFTRENFEGFDPRAIQQGGTGAGAIAFGTHDAAMVDWQSQAFA